MSLSLKIFSSLVLTISTFIFVSVFILSISFSFSLVFIFSVFFSVIVCISFSSSNSSIAILFFSIKSFEALLFLLFKLLIASTIFSEFSLNDIIKYNNAEVNNVKVVPTSPKIWIKNLEQ